ncbi:hypothetical protein FTX61_03660 [Nitriliruptoraceae bacterium ZYF776]|nr:hypothetical protein [Profundirhabdus halotolerans]
MSTSRPVRVPLLRRATTALLSGALVVSLVALPSPSADAQVGPDLRINEFSSAGPGGSSDDFIELINLGDAPADLEGWALYRCAGTGSRSYDPQVPPFGEVTLAPGEIYVVAHEAATAEVTAVADEFYSVSLADGGSGVWLADPQERRVDSVGMYGPDIDSECGIDGGDLPNVLDYGRSQTYQRVAATGDNATDWVAAARTPGAANATAADPGVQSGDVLITELTNGGAAGSSDNFVEISNRGAAPVDISGWALSRCTASGIRLPSTVQATVPAGTTLDAGASFVFAHTVVTVPADVPHVRYTVSLANAGFGALLADADGTVRDAVGVFDQVASPCVQGTAAPNILDFGFDETWQRRTDTGDNAADFHVRPRTLGADVVPDPADDPVPPTLDGPVRVSELANAGPGGTSDNFFELGNFGDEPVDVSGWRVHRCQADGRRNATPQVTIAAGTTLAPGDTYLAVRAGGPLAGGSAVDATYTTSFAQEGFGVVVYDADGEVVDRAAAYGPASPSGGPALTPCTNELHVTTHLDTVRGMSFQRLGFDGRDATDFVEAPRTPGTLPDDLRRSWDRTAEELAPVAVDPYARPLAATDRTATADGDEVTLSVRAAHTTGADHEVELRVAPRLPLGATTRGFTGTSDVAPLAARTGDDETPIAADELPVDGRDAPTLVTDDHDAYPYQRYELAVGSPSTSAVEVAWSGRSVRSNEVQLYAYDHTAATWVLLDAAGGRVDEDVTLLGHAEVAATVRDGSLDVLVIDGPGTGAALRGSHDGFETFGDPSSYDGAMVHLTDTQFLAESHRDVYADMVQWILQYEDARRIDYSVHTGDIIETWLNGTHLEAVARDEFAAASDIMAMLDDAGHPYGILPGNHDDKWGRDKDLYEEYFGLERYADNPWFGGSFPAGTNHNHWDLIEIGGKEILVVNLGYFEGDAAIAWANEVIAAHPDHDVIFATHEYLNTEADHSTTENYRWTSLGRRYFEEIVAPNENVFLTLSGHYHGIAQAVRRVEDGIAGPDGRVVLELLADYQNFEREGLRDTGFQRLLQFDWDAGLLAVNTYSPTLGEHNSYAYDQPARRYGPEDDEFLAELTVTSRYDKRVATDSIGVQELSDGDPLVRAEVADGEVVTATYTGDAPVAWYAVSRDADGQVARSAVHVVGSHADGGDDDGSDGGDDGSDGGDDGGDDAPAVRCSPTAAGFGDVPAGSVHRDAVSCLADLGIVRGKGDGRFDPAGAVRRDQAASMVARFLAAHDVDLPTGRGFPDVPASSPHADAVASLAELGVLLGKDGGRFDPAGTLTRAQTASLLVRAVSTVTGASLPPGPDAFADDDGSPHEAAIDAAAKAGLVEGKDGRRFAPGDDVRRDQLASLLARAIGHLAS